MFERGKLYEPFLWHGEKHCQGSTEAGFLKVIVYRVSLSHQQHWHTWAQSITVTFKTLLELYFYPLLKIAIGFNLLYDLHFYTIQTLPLHRFLFDWFMLTPSLVITVWHGLWVSGGGGHSRVQVSLARSKLCFSSFILVQSAFRNKAISWLSNRAISRETFSALKRYSVLCLEVWEVIQSIMSLIAK